MALNFFWYCSSTCIDYYERWYTRRCRNILDIFLFYIISMHDKRCMVSLSLSPLFFSVSLSLSLYMLIVSKLSIGKKIACDHLSDVNILPVLWIYCWSNCFFMYEDNDCLHICSERKTFLCDMYNANEYKEEEEKRKRGDWIVVIL
jgi:hypothetical protein